MPPASVGMARSELWNVPWGGRTAELTVKTDRFGGSLSVLVDGVRVASHERATLDNPWVECPVPGSTPAILVAQMQVRRYIVRNLVFIGGVDIDSGLSLEAWRAQSPSPIDRFEQAFMGPWLGPIGALVVGAVAALPFLSELARTRQPSWAVLAVGGFLAGSGWILGLARLVHWLGLHHYWSWRLRRLVVILAVLGLPLGLVILLQILLPSS